MAEIVKDYLGHPCKTTEAFDRFSESVQEARSKTGSKAHVVAREVGIALLDIVSRTDRMHEGLSAALLVAKAEGLDCDPLQALLEISQDYGHDCCNEIWQFAGLVLLALEIGGLQVPAK